MMLEAVSVSVIAQSSHSFQSWPVLVITLHLLGIVLFAYVIAQRMMPLLRAQSDMRFDRPVERVQRVLKFWLAQWKHPRYMTAGLLHILIFAGFILLATRAFSMLIFGFHEDLEIPKLPGALGYAYGIVGDYATTVVFLCMIFAAARRIVFKPARYEVPEKTGLRTHKADALFLLGLIALLMFADSLFDGAKTAVQVQFGHDVEFLAPYSLPWLLQQALLITSTAALASLERGAYLLHSFAFFFLLCYRPFGIQFHVITSLFNVYFAKLDRGTIKPVRWGVADENLDQVTSLGIKRFEDFTWKHILDFYSCADCGRCADNCPSNAVGRPLAPRFLTIKARDYAFQHYPVFGKAPENGKPLIGTLYSEDEIWSCTTCGVCEEECPLMIEYIDKIVDLRRGMIDDGNVPRSLQKPLKALESRGNPYGKMEKKRADWAKDKGFAQSCEVRVLDGKTTAGTLYFVDSSSSYDDRMQSIARATARILRDVGEDFGILGPAEKDSGHEVRRFGEEMLFHALREQNTEAIRASGAKRIITNDPHALNALRHDYKDVPPVEHISQFIARELDRGNLKLNHAEDGANVYAYHDPCYLGRHNQVYDDPRAVLDAIPGLKRVEMKRCRDRSFCCGGGGLNLFYEPQEEGRMGVMRVEMAAEAGANVIVTACPFCLVQIEDAIKVAGMEGKMTAIDLAELVDKHIVRSTSPSLTEAQRTEPAVHA